jgi:hypothetical protein
MKKFLVLYHSTMSNKDQMMGSTPEQVKAIMDAWGVWAKNAGSSLVDMGAPVGETARIKGTAGTTNVGGYSFVQADTLGGAKGLFKSHPHLGAPGASIEILELTPMQGM